MNPGIFLIQNNEELVEMNEQQYDSEKLLQDWLARYPALLVGNQIDPDMPRRFLLIEQECGVPGQEGAGDRWKIDHMFLDQSAIPTIVEVKRSTDTRVRREVVGQILDYAANAVAHWPVSQMRERFTANCKNSRIDAEEKLREFLEEEIEPEEFWQKAESNLKERRLRLVFIADRIPPELQSIVEFLNEQMDHTEVLAIEIKQYVSKQGLRSLVPRVIGQTSKAREVKAPPGGRSRTSEDEFFANLHDRSAEAARVAMQILDWSRRNFTVVEWEAASFVPKLDYGAEFSHNPITVFGLGRVPRVSIKFGRMKNRNHLSEEVRLELKRRLNEIEGVNLDSIDKFPAIPLSLLATEPDLERFLSAIAWTIEQVKTTENDQ
jgi:hypothetical protein